ncbi:hypothetical protein PUNSTDRAFT_50380 [Punctularia strigosozonata HHB-11173 SS5]|uniref:uncharacterized protein n=1 Tax=Punctularia strigosozonata (strain HHB-11173) TaxID=741275 RepID=UPI0004416958|nr:uncharacterized protein PUNSTDRAFT_50380 [Punctularia strigosozonata HHB-11173 SS5]EIN11326.1 hypothetical protein PUNSTDRAFT_50380 [Punctularia strigosozonata HHB-11173 SS5]
MSSKSLKKTDKKANKSITDFFTRSSVAPSSSPVRGDSLSARGSGAPSSSFLRSSASKGKAKADPIPSTPTKTRRRSPRKKNQTNTDGPKPDQEIISVSSGTRSHISISSGTQSHVTISSSSSHNPTRPVEVKDEDKPRSNIWPSSSLTSMSSSPFKSPGTPRRFAFAEFTRTSSPSPRRSERIRELSLTPSRSKPATASCLRTPSTSNILATPRRGVLKPLSPIKRKKIFESESDSEREDKPKEIVRIRSTVSRGSIPRIGINTPPIASTPKENVSMNSSRTSSSKKRRLNPPPAPSSCHLRPPVPDRDELRVPSSQSDEQELVFPRFLLKDPEEVKQSVEQWRLESSQPEPSDVVLPWPEPAVDVDADMDTAMDPPFLPFDNSSVGASSAEVGAYLARPASPGVSFDAIDDFARATTPVSESSAPIPMPATPVQMDDVTKAADIIAGIKANAIKTFALSDSSGSPLASSFASPAGSEASVEVDLFAELRNKRMLPPKEEVTSTSASTAPRYNLRNRSANGTPSTDPTSVHSSPVQDEVTAEVPARRTRASIRLSRDALPQPPVPARDALAKTRAKPRVSNPLDALIREKKAADSKGKGQDARLRAAIFADDGEGSEGQEGEGGPSDHNAALEAAKKWSTMQWDDDDVSPPAKTRGAERNHVRDEDEGEDEQHASGSRKVDIIQKMLSEDQQETLRQQQEPNDSDDALTSIWQDEFLVDPNSTQHGLPRLSGCDDCTSPLLRSLSQATVDGETAKVEALLRSGLVVSAVDGPGPARCVFQWLLRLALYSPRHPLSDLAFDNLKALATVRDQLCFRSQDLLTLAVHLGLKKSVMEEMGWECAPCHEIGAQVKDVTTRTEALRRLTSIVSIYAKNGCIEAGDVPNMVSMLASIALDCHSTAHLRLQLTDCIEQVCACLPLQPEARSLLIIHAARMLTQLANKFKLSPRRKVELLSVLPITTAGGGRIARWTAHAFLLGSLPEPMEARLPELMPLVELLIPSFGTDSVFKLDQQTNYETLNCFVNILSVALTGLEEYMDQERQIIAHGESAPSGGANNTSIPTPLQSVRDALMKVHSKIADTRAAHLDRSRVKSALQRLAMRVYFQRDWALQSGPGSRKGKTLKDFLSTAAGPQADT